MKTPNFFIVGAPKCGTSSLAAWLGEHPNVYMTQPKEPFYFDTDHVVMGRPSDQEYSELYSGVNEAHLAIGEASTTYLESAVAIEKILAYSGNNTKFIVCLRNPVGMLLSLHKHLVFNGIQRERSFAAAWEGSASGVSRNMYSRTVMQPQQLDYKSQSRIGAQLERLYRSVESEQVLVLFLDELAADPAVRYRDVLRFLSVPDDSRTQFSKYNVGRIPKSMVLAGAVGSVEILKRSLGIRRGFGILSIIRKLNSASSSDISVDEDVLEEVREYCRPDVVKLGTMLNRDLSHWLEPEAMGST